MDKFERLRKLAGVTAPKKKTEKLIKEDVTKDIGGPVKKGGSHLFYLVLSATPNSEIVDVITEVDLMGLLSIAVGAGSPDIGKIMEIAKKEEWQLFPHDKQSQALDLAKERLADAKGEKKEEKKEKEDDVKEGLTGTRVSTGVLSAVKEMIDMCKEKAKNAVDKGEKQMHADDAEGLTVVLAALKRGDKKDAKAAYRRLETAPRDDVLELMDKRERAEFAKFVGADLLHENKTNRGQCKDGTGKPVKFTHAAIKRALLGDTNYVGCGDVTIVANEEQDDIGLSVHDRHVDSFPIKDIDTAVGEFMSRIENEVSEGLNEDHLSKGQKVLYKGAKYVVEVPNAKGELIGIATHPGQEVKLVNHNELKVVTEGTWSAPQTEKQAKELAALMKSKVEAAGAIKKLYDLVGDDDLFDKIDNIADRNPTADIRPQLRSKLKQWIKNMKNDDWKDEWEPKALAIVKKLTEDEELNVTEADLQVTSKPLPPTEVEKEIKDLGHERPADISQPAKDHEEKVTVPASVMTSLKEKISEAKKKAEMYKGRDDGTETFWLTVADALEVLKMHLEMGTVEHLKLAQIDMTKLMSILVDQIPIDAYEFIVHGGKPMSLKDRFLKVKDEKKGE